MRSTPDQHDPDWPKYPETVLHFATDPKVTIDLRVVMGAEDHAALRRIGLGEPFVVMTAFDPRGENLSREENDARAERLDARLRESGYSFTRVDACSPDGEHCECSVAVKMPRDDAVKLATEFEQVAIFWFDGEMFWIIGAWVEADPMMLPRSS
jgi:hypothetical protein